MGSIYLVGSEGDSVATPPLPAPPPAMAGPQICAATAVMEPGSPSTRGWAPKVEAALEAGSPCRLLEALGRVPCGASHTVTPHRLPPPSEFFVGSPGLLREILVRGPRERVALSDSKDL